MVTPQLDGTTTYPTWLQYDTGRTLGSEQEPEQRGRAEQREHPCVVRGPMEPVVQYAHETALERARREVEGEQPRVEPPFWGCVAFVRPSVRLQALHHAHGMRARLLQREVRAHPSVVSWSTHTVLIGRCMPPGSHLLLSTSVAWRLA